MQSIVRLPLVLYVYFWFCIISAPSMLIGCHAFGSIMRMHNIGVVGGSSSSSISIADAFSGTVIQPHFTISSSPPFFTTLPDATISTAMTTTMPTTTTTAILGDNISSSTTNFVLAVTTVDPTTFLTDLLGSFINSPAILAIPIVAALSVASLIAFLIQAYATPQVEDDE
jgi:hypothetical protein